MDGLHHAGREPGLAARSRLQSAAHGFVTGGVPAVAAALAFGADAVDEEPDVLGVELAEPLLAQAGDEVEADDALVALVGLRAAFLADDVLVPVGQEVGQRPVFG